MSILDQKQKKELGFKFLHEECNYREIQKRVHVSPGLLPKLKRNYYERTLFLQINLQKSQNIKAIDLIRHGNKPMEIALKLNIDANEVNKAYSDYFKLNNLDKFPDLIKPENGKNLTYY